ncbi:hypothetical protein N9948_02095 [bacterium]|nr:hypothetical protein [bacterium]
MLLRWNHRAFYISPGKGKLVKITNTNAYKELEATNVYTVEIKQEFI